MNGAKITFFGNLTQDPELNYASQSAKPYTKARIAVNTYLGQDKEDQSDFYNQPGFTTRRTWPTVSRKETGFTSKGHSNPTTTSPTTESPAWDYQ